MNAGYPTPYFELNAVLQKFVSRCHRILRENFLAAYLQGSFAIGDFDEYSDCDFIVVIDREMSDSDIQILQSMHRQIFNLGPEWAKHLEGSYFPRAILRDYAKCGSDLWYLDNGHCELIRSSHCNTVIVRSILREKGVVLTGPEPSTIIKDIPVQVLRRAIFASINESGRLILSNPDRFNNRFYQGFIVLQWCRKLHDLHVGKVGSKRAGAEWAKQNLDKSWSGLIDRAWSKRPNPAESVRQPADADEFQRTLEFVKDVMRLANEYVTQSESE